MLKHSVMTLEARSATLAFELSESQLTIASLQNKLQVRLDTI